MRALFFASLLLAISAGCIDDRSSASDDPETDAEAGGPASDDFAVPPPPPEADMAVPDASMEISCEESADCPEGSTCEGGICTEPDCVRDDDCGSALQACYQGECRDRCFGPGTCFRGGECIDGVCRPPECQDDADCADGERCRDGTCDEIIACMDDEICGPDGLCVGGECEPLPVCVGDRGCPDGSICLEGRCRPREGCETRADCLENEDCVSAICVPFVCRGVSDCPGEEVCQAGQCVIPEEAEVAAVIILTPPQTLTEGDELRLVAVGLDLRGDIVINSGFDWSSSQPDVAAFIGDSSRLEFGPAEGTTEVTARYENANGESVESQAVSFRVTSPSMEPGARVHVVDAQTGRPVGGADVLVGEVLQTTDETGVATFDDVDAAYTVTAFAEGFDYLTVVGAPPGDVVLPLTTRTPIDRIAGFTGTVDFDRVMTNGEVELGLTGPSFAGGLGDLSIAALLGQTFNRSINAGPVNVDLPLPGGVTLAAEVPIVGQVVPKDEYYITSQPGLRLAWSFAGRIEINSVIDLAQGGGGQGIGQVLAVLLPYFETFNHGLRVAERLVSLPFVADEDDIDEDSDVIELQPDYERFPVLDVEPGQTQALRLSIDAGDLVGPEEITIFFPGVELEEIGFVPLGVTAATESGVIPARMAAPYGGLEGGAPTVLAVRAVFEDPSDLPTDITLHIQRYDEIIPANIEFEAERLNRPSGFEWDPVMRTFQDDSDPDADAKRLVFNGAAGRWTVYFNEGQEPNIVLPVPPNGAPDLSAAGTARVESLALRRDTAFVNLVTLGEGIDLSRIDEVTQTVARSSVD